jgi:cytochrome c-type protein NapC
MRTNGAVRALSALLMLLVVWLVGTGAAQAQFAQKRDTIKIDPSGFPADIKKGYRLFGMKCAECHGLDTSLQPTMSASQWPVEVKRMQAMPSAQFNDAQAKAIIDFLLYYEANRKSLNKSEDRVGASGAGGAGSQLYETQGCASCHALGGKGGTSGPSLTDVGKRLSKEQLTEVIRKGKSSMPPLPAGTTDEQLKELVNFLAGDNSQPQKQTAVPEKKQETPTSQETKPKAVAAPSETESKPTAEAGASAAGGAGSQLYQTQGCASCHALAGKGGTSGPSLTDVGKRLSKEQLTEVIRKGKSSMPPLPASTTDEQLKDLVDFLAGDNNKAQKQTSGSEKKPEAPTAPESKLPAQAAPSATGSKPAAKAGASGGAGGAGSQLYQTQGCASCHALGGKGGTSGPSLTDVGKRLSREQLAEVIRKGKSSMPPLPAGTTEQQVKDLVDFLAGPNSRAQKQTAGVHKEPKTPTDQKSKPATQGEPSGNVVAAGLLGPQTGEGLARLQADDPNGPTALPGILLLFLIAVAAVLVSVLVFRPGLTATPGGKILAFLGLFILPLIAGWMGTTYHIDRSKSTTFCLSCHEMEPFGKSLLVDDPNHLAAAHFQNHRVPAGEACYTCHTNYAMFGGIRAKMGGLKHVYVHYLGTPPAPEAIRLYEPFNNRECLHCHLGARSFEEGATHNSSPYLLAALKGNQVSCLSCHKTVHDVAELNNAKFWKGVN